MYFNGEYVNRDYYGVSGSGRFRGDRRAEGGGRISVVSNRNSSHRSTALPQGTAGAEPRDATLRRGGLGSMLRLTSTFWGNRIDMRGPPNILALLRSCVGMLVRRSRIRRAPLSFQVCLTLKRLESGGSTTATSVRGARVRVSSVGAGNGRASSAIPAARAPERSTT
jgi:hypothetical protein